MTVFDIVIVSIFAISIVVGIMRGLVKEALSLMSWIGAIWLALTFNVQAGDWFSQIFTIPNATFRQWVGFALVFVGALFLFSLTRYFIVKLLVRGSIKGTDRFLGIFFGVARAGLIVVALLMLLRGVGMGETQWWQNARLLPYFIPAVDTIEPMVFDNLPESVSDDESLPRQILNQAVDDLSKPSQSNATVEALVPATDEQ